MNSNTSRRTGPVPIATAGVKFLGNPAEKMFERLTKATLEVKARHFVTTFKGGKINKKMLFAAGNDQITSKLFAIEQY